MKSDTYILLVSILVEPRSRFKVYSLEAAVAATCTITQLSKRTKIPQATLRYWERLGLLPRAARSHTGYRLFSSEALDYVDFVRKSKSIGLSLEQMKRVLDLAREGRSPCPEVEQWVLARLAKLRAEIRGLQ
jgi:DNA-binding transcriptional MerR regulator